MAYSFNISVPSFKGYGSFSNIPEVGGFTRKDGLFEKSERDPRLVEIERQNRLDKIERSYREAVEFAAGDPGMLAEIEAERIATLQREADPAQYGPAIMTALFPKWRQRRDEGQASIVAKYEELKAQAEDTTLDPLEAYKLSLLESTYDPVLDVEYTLKADIAAEAGGYVGAGTPGSIDIHKVRAQQVAKIGQVQLGAGGPQRGKRARGKKQFTETRAAHGAQL